MRAKFDSESVPGGIPGMACAEFTPQNTVPSKHFTSPPKCLPEMPPPTKCLAPKSPPPSCPPLRVSPLNVPPPNVSPPNVFSTISAPPNVPPTVPPPPPPTVSPRKVPPTMWPSQMSPPRKSPPPCLPSNSPPQDSSPQNSPTRCTHPRWVCQPRISGQAVSTSHVSMRVTKLRDGCTFPVPMATARRASAGYVLAGLSVYLTVCVSNTASMRRRAIFAGWPSAKVVSAP